MTDWTQQFPDEPAPPHNKNFADHNWEERTEGRVCRNCSLRWQDVLGEGSRACYGAHSERTAAQMEAERNWLWSTIIDAASGGTQ